jgi:hypothetical protein
MQHFWHAHCLPAISGPGWLYVPASGSSAKVLAMLALHCHQDDALLASQKSHSQQPLYYHRVTTAALLIYNIETT